MKKFFAKLAGLFKRVFTPTTLAMIERGLGNSVPYVSEAIQVAAWLASMTKSRSAGEISSAADAASVALPDWVKNAPPHVAIAYIAEQLLRERFPEAKLRHIRRAIEIAYGAVKP